MIKKEMIAMLLAGGQGSRLGVLTSGVAKPAVAFGGKYRIIDFPLSNCINSGIDTVGVLTQYQPLRLNRHIGIGIPWDLDRNNGGVTVLSLIHIYIRITFVAHKSCIILVLMLSFVSPFDKVFVNFFS